MLTTRQMFGKCQKNTYRKRLQGKTSDIVLNKENLNTLKPRNEII